MAAAGTLLLIAVLASGCSREPERMPVYPVTGQVTFDGRPAAGAWVTFHAKDSSTVFPTPKAKVDSGGRFSLTTYAADDGAPPGEYAVTVELRPVVQKGGELEFGANVLPPKYGSPQTTTVVVRVAEGENSIPVKITR